MGGEGRGELTHEELSRAATTALDDDRTVTDVTRIDDGMNAVYRVSFDDATDAVMKVGTAQEGPKLLSGPVLLERVADETTVPVPEVLAAVSEADSPFDAAYYLAEYVDGRTTADDFDLPIAARERLVREVASHLAALHELPYDGPYGWLQANDGELVPEHPSDSWAREFQSYVTYILDRNDDRFADLAPAFWAAAEGFPDVVDEAAVDRSILYWDAKPANLIIEPDDGADPLVRAVVDFNFRPVGDAPLDVAIAETTLVDLPFRGAGPAETLRAALREAYVDARGGTRADYFDERYPYYRLLPLVTYTHYFDYFAGFPRRAGDATVAAWLRDAVSTRRAELQ